MGAQFNSITFAAQSESELKINVNHAIADAKYDHGHEGYSGSLAEARGLRIAPNTFKTLNDAEDWLTNNHEKHSPILAVRVGDLTKSFRFSAAGKTLAEKINKLQTELDNYEVNFFKAQKREYIGCPSCGSKIHRTTLLKQQGFHGDCPVCNKTFMPESVYAKKQALYKKLDESKKISKEKLAKERDKIMWVVGGWMSS